MWSPKQFTHFQCRMVGHFTSPGIDTRYKGPTAFSVTLAKRGKWNCQSSEAKLPQRDSNPGPPGRQSNAYPLGHRAPDGVNYMCICLYV